VGIVSIVSVVSAILIQIISVLDISFGIPFAVILVELWYSSFSTFLFCQTMLNAFYEKVNSEKAKTIFYKIGRGIQDQDIKLNMFSDENIFCAFSSNFMGTMNNRNLVKVVKVVKCIDSEYSFGSLYSPDNPGFGNSPDTKFWDLFLEVSYSGNSGESKTLLFFGKENSMKDQILGITYWEKTIFMGNVGFSSPNLPHITKPIFLLRRIGFFCVPSSYNTPRSLFKVLKDAEE